MRSCTTLFLYFTLLCFQHVYGAPILKGVEDIHIITSYLPNYATVLISLGALLLFAYFTLGCVCCPNKSIKALSYQNGFPVSRLNENVFENTTEITIFPPHSTVIDLQPVSQSFPVFNDKVTFEPLPDILPKNFTTGQSAACSSRPAHFNILLKSKVSLHDWFDDPNSNFPREQLQYLQEIGIGWFGRVVEGEASQICDNEEKTPVIVKILREEASPSEHLHFLHEVRPYRDLKHSNIVKLLGRCLESDPFLLIMEHSLCDLKTYLCKKERKENFLQNELMLQMVCNIASGLHYMHDRGFCHMDLAAHNCFVTSDNVVKIGDYGISFDRWKCDYYCLGDIALPIRWYSPEILRCSETTIETKEITREANVWAFGVVLWEIAELGKLPYENLNDEDVLQKVLIDKNVQLSPPSSEMIFKDEILLVMRECWKSKRYRPPMEKIENFIIQLYNDHLSIKKQELSFEERWNALLPRVTEISSYTGTESSSLKFENDFSTRSDLQNYSSDNELLSSFEMSFDMLPKSGFNGQLSPSLNVLNGSIDELTENDVYLNSISLSCGKYDADTLSNISDKDNFQMEEDKENANVNNVISEQVTAAIRDLDLVLANQPDSSRNSTLLKLKPVLHDSEVNVKDKELLVNGILKEAQFLNKSSDLSNISENSFSKSSNFSEHVDQEIKSNDLSANSDLNGNCSFYDNVCQEHSEANSAELVYDSDQLYNRNYVYNNYQNTNVDIIEDADQFYTAENINKILETGHTNPIFVNTNKLPSIPDIVIEESPSIKAPENFEDYAESENEFCIEQDKNQKKSFRFIFKDDNELNEAEINDQDFNKVLAHNLSESLKTDGESKPLTSTPVRSSSDSKSSCSDLNVNKDNISNDVFCDSNVIEISVKVDSETLEYKSMPEEPSKTDFNTDVNSNPESSNFIKVESHQDTSSSIVFDHFTTAQSSLFLNDSELAKTKVFQSKDLNDIQCINDLQNDITLNFIDNEVVVNHATSEDIEPEKSNTSNTSYVSADSSISKEDYPQVLSDVISPPNGYVSSLKETNHDSDIENEYFEHSKASETVSPPQAFQDDGLVALNDSYSESKASFDPELSTSAECGSSENLDHYLEDDHVSHENISSTRLLETSFPDEVSRSFIYESCADFSGNIRPRKNSSSLNYCDSEQNHSRSHRSDYKVNDHQNYNLYENINAPIPSYDQMIVEDLNTGEQTVINESYSVCDDYENSGESDEILKINTETDEAIIVDSSEALIGFVPSRSIELLQEFEVIPPLNQSYALEEEKESSDSMNIDACNSASPSPAAMKHNSSPYESPEPAYPHPYRNFCLQNEVIEEEITDEIVSPSSFHSSSSYCSNEIYMDEEKMSQSSESVHNREMYETSILPSVDHMYVVSDDGSKTDVSSSECSPKQNEVVNEIVNTSYKTDSENNHIDDNDQDDIMHSFQPTQSIRWLSDETLEIDGDDHSPIIIEGREILAGDIIQTCELTAEDIASALNHLDVKGNNHGMTPDHLSVSQSPSPFSSVESSPCRDAVYTPDFESDSEESNSGTSCSSTSGSFECIHNKFKDTINISAVPDESDRSASSREQSPMKIFSKTWDCHATPTKGVLITPEKKFNSMRKSVSFHEEDPHVVFEYPPASDSSEDGYPSDDNEQFPHNIDYLKYADWDLQVNDTDDNPSEEIVEIEELDSEPYVRRPTYSSSSVGPLNRPMLYTLTAGFSDEDFDLSDTVPPFSFNAPSNSPDEEKEISFPSTEISELIQQHLNNLAEKEKQAEINENRDSSQNSTNKDFSAPMMPVQESNVSPIETEDIIIEEMSPHYQTNSKSKTVHNDVESHDDKLDDSDSDDDDEEIEEVIIEELSDGESASDSFEFNDKSKPVVLETDNTFLYEKEFMKELPEESENTNKLDVDCAESFSLDSDVSNSPKFNEAKENIVPEILSEIIIKPEHESENRNESFGIDLDKLNANEDLINNIQSVDDNSETLYNVEKTLSKENTFLTESIFQNALVNSELCTDKTDLHETNNIDTSCIVDIKSDISNTADSQFLLSENPVHSLCLESSSREQSNNVLNDICHVSKILTNADMSESLSPSNLLKEKESKFIIPSIESVVPEDVNGENECSTDEILPINHNNEMLKCSEISSEHCNLSEKQSDASINTDSQSENFSKNLVSDNSALINILDESPVKTSVAQNITQSVSSSSSAFADLSDIFFPQVTATNEITEVQSSTNLCSSESKVDMTLHVKKETSSDSTHIDQKCDSPVDVPKIIVTPASESDVEDELEEYLRGQLKHFHSETSPQQDFSVTSEFSSRPFEDVFGSYFSGDSSDYIEAFNFEFENGNFFDDYIDDYPHDLQTGISDSLIPDNGHQKRSSSLPLMTENLSDEESLTVKSDSSLVYDSSKGVTRL